MRYRLQRHDGTDCSATMVPITVLRMVPIQRYRHGSREARILYYASVCFRHGYCIQIIALILVIINYKSYICLI